MKKANTKKFKNKLLNFIFVVIIICVLYNIIFLLNTSILRNKYMKLFGISFFCMKDNLMKNDINKNDLVIIKEVKNNQLKEGDIIAYEINNNIRINKITNIKEKITTKFNQNYYYDIEQITSEQIIGKKIINIPFLGILLNILQSQITSFFIFFFLILGVFYNKYIYEKRIQRFRKKRAFEIWGNDSRISKKDML